MLRSIAHLAAFRGTASARSKASSSAPNSIHYSKANKTLEVKWPDGYNTSLPAEYLRVQSPSAEVVGHDGVRRVVAGRSHVGIMKIQPVGSYAIRLVFDDLHDSGIYSWDLLRTLGQEKWPRMRAYIQGLRASGKSRHPSGY